MRYSIVGQKFRGLDPYLPGVQAGIPALLVREPENQYDAFAVAVYIEGKHVGYLSKRDNVEIAKKIDSEGKTYAESIAAIGLAVDANSPMAQQRALKATFVRSHNSSYPQVDIA